jgi:C-terminal processing protease CtpA/Prc
MIRSQHVLAVAFIATGLVTVRGEAQELPMRVRTIETPRAFAYSITTDRNRPVIGVAVSYGTKNDTLGLQVEDVTPESPAAKAGITAGSRLQEINGVSLRLSADDAGDPLTADAGYQRLQRELGKVKVGDAVSLRVLSNGQTRTVSVTTARVDDFDGMFTQLRTPVRTTRESLENRAALGLSLGSSGSARDTLGVFVSSVVTDGPAEKAGVFEGDRIAAINGVDVRVPREDARDDMAASARVSRLQREVSKLAPGDRVTLRVFSNGRYREVEATAGKASELGGGVFRFEGGDLENMVRLFRSTPEAPGTIRAVPAVPRVMPAPPVPARRSGTISVRADM